jgi:hypothetical protein
MERKVFRYNGEWMATSRKGMVRLLLKHGIKPINCWMPFIEELYSILKNQKDPRMRQTNPRIQDSGQLSNQHRIERK